MRIASKMVITGVALLGVVQARDVAAAADACEPNFYAIDMTYTTANAGSMTQFQTVLNAAAGTKCYSETSGPTTGHTYCLYTLAAGGVPPPTPEMLGVFAGLSSTTPLAGGKGPVTITSVTSEMTCKPKVIGGCVTVNCSLGTMSIPNCRACGQ